AANRMQRAVFDLVGVQCDADDQRPWAWQAAWPIDQFPLRRDFVASPKWEPGEEDYPFVRVAGDGVHEIAVGPVHAGIIEPGQFSRLKEDLLRVNAKAFGHRLLMDVVIPGGVAHDLDAEAAAALRAQGANLVREIRVLRDIYDEHAGLQDRFRQCGQVTVELAAKLGLTGFAARASALADDLRCDFSMPPYDALAVRKITQTSGDVAARVAMRFDETF